MSLYRAPNTNDGAFLKAYSSLLEKIKIERKHVIIGTDHNYDLLKSAFHKNTQKFLDQTMSADMWPVITKPTRITKSSATLIDNIIVSPGIYSDYQCGILLDDLSDHLPCILIAHGIRIKKKERLTITSRKITPKTLQQIKLEITKSNLTGSSTQKEDVNLLFERVHREIISIVDRISPFESFTPSRHLYHREAWLPFNLLRCVNKQKTLYKKCLQSTSTEVDRLKYKN